MVESRSGRRISPPDHDGIIFPAARGCQDAMASILPRFIQGALEEGEGRGQQEPGRPGAEPKRCSAPASVDGGPERGPDDESQRESEAEEPQITAPAFRTGAAADEGREQRHAQHFG